MSEQIEKVTILNGQVWENIGEQDMNLDINLVRCYRKLFPNGKNKKILYIGFGEGKNLLYFAEQGFECYGTELSLGRVERVRALFQNNGKNADLRQVKSMVLPFENDFFDIVVGWQSLYYNNEEGFTKILEEIHRVLKPEGGFLSSLLSSDHVLCGKEISPNIFQPVNTPNQTDAILFVPKDQDQIKRLYKNFKNIQFGFYSFQLFKGFDFHHVIWCKK